MCKRWLKILIITCCILPLTGCFSAYWNMGECEDLAEILHIPNPDTSLTTFDINKDALYVVPDWSVDGDSSTFNVGTQAGIPESGDDELGMLSWIAWKTSNIVEPMSKAVLTNIITNQGYQNFLHASILLCFVLFWCAVLLGVTNASPYAVFILFMKLIVIYTVCSQVDFYWDLIPGTFENLSAGLGAIFAAATHHAVDPTLTINNLQDALSIFLRGGDSILTMILSGGYFKLINASASWRTIFHFMLLVFVLVRYTTSCINLCKIIVVAEIARHLFYCVGPYFISCACHKETRSLFDGWIQQVFNFTLQPVCVMAAVGPLHMICIGVFDSALYDSSSGAYEICARWESFFGIFSRPKYVMLSSSGDYANVFPISISGMVVLMLLVYVMEGMAQWAVQFVSTTTGALSTINMGAAVPGGSQQMMQAAGSQVKGAAAGAGTFMRTGSARGAYRAYSASARTGRKNIFGA